MCDVFFCVMCLRLFEFEATCTEEGRKAPGIRLLVQKVEAYGRLIYLLLSKLYIDCPLTTPVAERTAHVRARLSLPPVVSPLPSYCRPQTTARRC
jgi:hypothetical protein